MNKFILAVVVALTLAFAFADPLIVDHGDEWFRISTKKEGSNYRLRVGMGLEDNLTTLKAATVICFHTDKNYNLKSGAKGFGFTAWCTVTECTSNHHLGASFFGSSLKSTSPPTWAGAGSDVSHTNKGVTSVKGGDNPDFIYKMTPAEFGKSNVPQPCDETYLRCYAKYDCGFYDTNLLTDLNLKGWKEAKVKMN